MWMDEFETIDFHTHILPGKDHGAADIDEAVALLTALGEQGIDKVVSTSHYYNHCEDVSSFLAGRDEALYRLERYIKESDIYAPEIIPGAEVQVYVGLCNEERLDELCIGDSKYILVEMPYDKWTPWMYNEVYGLTARGYTPVMAHLERYSDSVSEKEIREKILVMDVLVQCNGDSLFDRKKRRFVKKLVKWGYTVLLGSDCHYSPERMPHMDEAMAYVSKKFGGDYLKDIMTQASDIVKNM